MKQQLKQGGLLLVAGVMAAGFSIGFKHLISSEVGGACSEPNYCRGALCVGATPLSTAKVGYCSKQCRRGEDCPAGYGCDELQVEELGRPPRPMLVCIRH